MALDNTGKIVDGNPSDIAKQMMDKVEVAYTRRDETGIDEALNKIREVMEEMRSITEENAQEGMEYARTYAEKAYEMARGVKSRPVKENLQTRLATDVSFIRRILEKNFNKKAINTEVLDINKKAAQNLAVELAKSRMAGMEALRATRNKFENTAHTSFPDGSPNDTGRGTFDETRIEIDGGRAVDDIRDAASDVGDNLGRSVSRFQLGMLGVLGTLSAVLTSIGNSFNLNMSEAWAGVLSNANAYRERMREVIFQQEGYGRLNRGIEDTWRNIYGYASASGKFTAQYQQKQLENMEKGFEIQSAWDKAELKNYKADQRADKWREMASRRLNAVTGSALNTASMLNMSADAVNETFFQWHRQLGMSTAQIGMMAEAMKDVARTTGVTGPHLERALKASEQLAKNLRDSGGFTAEAGRNIIEMTANFQKYGIEDAGNEVLQALSSMDAFTNARPEIQSSLIRAAADAQQATGRDDLVAKVRFGGALQDRTAMKAISQQSRKDFQSIMSNQFQEQVNNALGSRALDLQTITPDQIPELINRLRTEGGEQGNTIAGLMDMLSKNVYGMEIGKKAAFDKSLEESTLTASERLNKMSEELATLTKGSEQYNQLLAKMNRLKVSESSAAFSTLSEVLRTASDDIKKLSPADQVKALNDALLKRLTPSMGEDAAKSFLADTGKSSKALVDMLQDQAKLAGKDFKSMLKGYSGQSIEDFTKGLATGDKQSLDAMNTLMQQLDVSNKAAEDPISEIREQIRQANITLSQIADFVTFGLPDWALKMLAILGKIGGYAAAFTVGLLGFDKFFGSGIFNKIFGAKKAGAAADPLASFSMDTVTAGAEQMADAAGNTLKDRAKVMGLSMFEQAKAFGSKLLSFASKWALPAALVVAAVGGVVGALQAGAHAAEIFGTTQDKLTFTQQAAAEGAGLLTGALNFLTFGLFSGALGPTGSITKALAKFFDAFWPLGLLLQAIIIPIKIVIGVLKGLWRLFLNVFSGIGQMFQSIFEPVLEFGKQVYSMFAAALAPLAIFQKEGSAAFDVMEMVASGIGWIGKVIGGVFSIVGKVIGGVLKVVSTVVIPVFKWLADVLKNVVNVVAGFLEILAGIFTLNAGMIGDGIGKIFSGIGGLLYTIFVKSFVAIGEAIWAAVKGIGRAIVAVFFDLPAMIGRAILNGLQSLAANEWFGPIFAPLWELAQSIGNFFSSLAELGSAVMGLLSKLGQVVGAVLMVPIMAIQRIWEKVKPFLGPVGDWIEGFFQGLSRIGNAFMGLFGVAGDAGFLTGLVTVLKGVVWGISSVIGGFIKLVVWPFQIAIDAVTALIKGASWVIRSVSNAISEPFKYVQKIVNDTVDGIIAPFKWLYNILVGHSIVPDLVTGIVKWFAMLPFKMLGMAGKAVMGVIGFFAELPGKVFMHTLKLGRKVLSGFTSFFTKLVGRIGGLFGDLFSKIGNFIWGLKDIKLGSVAGGLRDKAGELALKAKGFFERIFGFIKNLPGTVVQIFKNGWQWIKNGAKSAGQWISRAASRFAETVKTSWKMAKDFFKKTPFGKALTSFVNRARNLAKSLIENVAKSPIGKMIGEKVAKARSLVKSGADYVRSGKFVEMLRDKLGRAGESFRKFVGQAAERAKNLFTKGAEIAKSWFAKGAETAKNLFTKGGETAKIWLGRGVDAIKGVGSKIAEAAKPIINKVVETAKPIINKVAEVAKPLVTKGAGIIGKGLSAISGILPSAGGAGNGLLATGGKMLGGVGKLASKVPIIGGLIDFGLRKMEGQDTGQAVVGATGSAVGGAAGMAAGSAIGGGIGTFLGGLAGSFAGMDLGGKIGDMVYNGLGPAVGWIGEQFSGFGKSIMDAGSWLGEKAMGLGQGVVDAVGAGASVLVNAAGQAGNVIKDVAMAPVKAGMWAGEKAMQAGSWLGEKAGAALNAINPFNWFAAGTMGVQQEGLAYVHAGEMILPPDMNLAAGPTGINEGAVGQSLAGAISMVNPEVNPMGLGVFGPGLGQEAMGGGLSSLLTGGLAGPLTQAITAPMQAISSMARTGLDFMTAPVRGVGKFIKGALGIKDEGWQRDVAIISDTLRQIQSLLRRDTTASQTGLGVFAPEQASEAISSAMQSGLINRSAIENTTVATNTAQRDKFMDKRAEYENNLTKTLAENYSQHVAGLAEVTVGTIGEFTTKEKTQFNSYLKTAQEEVKKNLAPRPVGLGVFDPMNANLAMNESMTGIGRLQQMPIDETQRFIHGKSIDRIQMPMDELERIHKSVMRVGTGPVGLGVFDPTTPEQAMEEAFKLIKLERGLRIGDLGMQGPVNQRGGTVAIDQPAGMRTPIDNELERIRKTMLRPTTGPISAGLFNADNPMEANNVYAQYVAATSQVATGVVDNMTEILGRAVENKMDSEALEKNFVDVTKALYYVGDEVDTQVLRQNRDVTVNFENAAGQIQTNPLDYGRYDGINTNILDYGQYEGVDATLNGPKKGEINTNWMTYDNIQEMVAREKYTETPAGAAPLTGLNDLNQYLTHQQAQYYMQMIGLLQVIKENTTPIAGSNIVGPAGGGKIPMSRPGVKAMARDYTRGAWDLTFHDTSTGSVTTDGRGGS